MALDIVRRFVNGAWKTEAAETGGGGGLPVGGTTGQVLTKESNADGDAGWENGGSLPAQWTVAADGSLNIEPTGDGALGIQWAGDANATVVAGVADAGGGARNAVLQIESDGGGLAQVQVVAHGGDENSVVLEGAGTVDFYTAPGSYPIRAWDSLGNVLRFAVIPSGQPMIGVLAAPADGDLSAGQVALWFDDTNGAAKLKIKGKSANGTVVVGEVALT